MVANASNFDKPVTSAAAKVSERRLRANRRNAKKSTGPRTEAGKDIASRNALVHGVHCADHVLMPGESQGQFLMLRNDFVLSLKPANAIELMLVERIAISQWKILRLRKHERCLYEHELSEAEKESRQSLEELEQELDDAAESAPRKVSSARLSLGMIEHDTFPVEWIQARQWADEQSARQLERLSRLEQRLEASIDKAMRELERLRAGAWRRRKEDDSEPDELSTLRYQLDRDDLHKIGDEEVKQARRAVRELQTVRNEATDADEVDKLRVRRGLEEEDEEPAQVQASSAGQGSQLDSL
jgi:hypothetical protein